MASLAIFDLDGTLTQSARADGACFVRACTEVVGVETIDTDWASYVHTTDSGIAREVFERGLGRPPEPAELERLERRFLELLEQEIGGSRLRQVPGASRALDALRAEPDWQVAIATGAWSASARLKLASAGLRVDDIPMATADDAVARVDIVRAAVGRIGAPAPERIVLLGDRPWDVRAAAELGHPLVGISCEGSHDALADAGAETILEDYLDLDRFHAALEAARPPRHW